MKLYVTTPEFKKDRNGSRYLDIPLTETFKLFFVGGLLSILAGYCIYFVIIVIYAVFLYLIGNPA